MKIMKYIVLLFLLFFFLAGYAQDTTQKTKCGHSIYLEIGGIWNVHSQSENIKAVKKNPDIIQTDNLVHLVKILNK
jgi:hypothetical protein